MSYAHVLVTATRSGAMECIHPYVIEEGGDIHGV
jgi:hypothetical protein